MAIGGLGVLRRHKLRVPGDVAVTGFDDIATGRHVRPTLTTVRQPMRDIGETAVRTLLARLADRDAARHTAVLPTELVVLRASCGCSTRGGAQMTDARTDWERRIYRRLTETTAADPASELPAPDRPRVDLRHRVRPPGVAARARRRRLRARARRADDDREPEIVSHGGSDVPAVVDPPSPTPASRTASPTGTASAPCSATSTRCGTGASRSTARRAVRRGGASSVDGDRRRRGRRRASSTASGGWSGPSG